MDRFIIEFGMGVDFHGQDVTKAAVKAAKDAISKSCLIGLNEICGFNQDNVDDKVLIDVTIGVTRPDEVRIDEVVKCFPVGTVSYTHLDVYKRQIQSLLNPPVIL